jgi:hypothetical protein
MDPPMIVDDKSKAERTAAPPIPETTKEPVR